MDNPILFHVVAYNSSAPDAVQQYRYIQAIPALARALSTQKHEEEVQEWIDHLKNVREILRSLDEGNQLIVAHTRGKIVGVILFQRLHGNHFRNHFLGVHPDFQGQGIGKQLIKKEKTRIQQLGGKSYEGVLVSGRLARHFSKSAKASKGSSPLMRGDNPKVSVHHHQKHPVVYIQFSPDKKKWAGPPNRKKKPGSQRGR